MASKLLFLNSLKEKNKKPKTKDSNTDHDELALVKAAAWAWYQHGSGSEGNKTTMIEFDATRAERTKPRPSRYKLEAIRRPVANYDDSGEAKELRSPIQSNNSLLDAYEVESISRQIDGIIESNQRNKNDKLVNGINNNNTASATKKNRKGFWLIRHAAVCGRGEDVVDGSRQSAKPVLAAR